MHNFVERFTPDVEATDDDGVVAIEYVLVAGLVAIGVAITFGSSLWTTMLGKLNGLFT
jgi:Flp pilus assembly pilin Flp